MKYREPWTNDERRRAVALAAAGEPLDAIAAALDRPRPGVAWQLQRLGVRAKHRPYSRPDMWTDADDRRVTELALMGCLLRVIGAKLDRSVQAVSARLRRLGVRLPPRVYTPAPPRKCARPEREPTEAELDATIAEQMRRLPRWWYLEVERARQAELVSDAVLRETARCRVRLLR